jgi:hypothetical protein
MCTAIPTKEWKIITALLLKKLVQKLKLILKN